MSQIETIIGADDADEPQASTESISSEIVSTSLPPVVTPKLTSIVRPSQPTSKPKIIIDTEPTTKSTTKRKAKEVAPTPTVIQNTTIADDIKLIEELSSQNLPIVPIDPTLLDSLTQTSREDPAFFTLRTEYSKNILQRYPNISVRGAGIIGELVANMAILGVIYPPQITDIVMKVNSSLKNQA